MDIIKYIDKFSRLDVKATTDKGEVINIEIQVKNEYNIIKRSLYYWSKLYEEQLGNIIALRVFYSYKL